MGRRNWRISLAFKQGACQALCYSRFIFTLAVCSMFHSGYVAASDMQKLVEVGTYGETSSTEVYFKDIQKNEVNIDQKQLESLREKAKQSISEELFFPISSKNMQPGLMKGYRFKEKRAIQPFAVVGTDPLSEKWLQTRLSKLSELNAPIFVVEAESFELVRSFASGFKPLKFVPSSGDGIAKELNVAAYPFLVTSSGVWQ